MYPPGRVPAFGWVEGTRMSQPAPTCFLSRQTTPTRPGLYRKTPLHSARSGRASQLAGESAPRWGSFCAAVQHLTFLRRMPPSGGRGCGVSAPARRVPFRMHEKEPKVHIRGYPPYGTPGRVPAFGWVERTRMSQPAPTCFLPRQAPSTRPGPHRRTSLHCARTDRCTRPAGEGHTGRGHCPLARKAHPARASRVSALRAESPRSEGRCFGLEPKTTCARCPLARKAN